MIGRIARPARRLLVRSTGAPARLERCDLPPQNIGDIPYCASRVLKFESSFLGPFHPRPLHSPSGPLAAIVGRLPLRPWANKVRTLVVAGNRGASFIAERVRKGPKVTYGVFLACR